MDDLSSSFLSIAMGLLFLSVGTLLFVYHQSIPLPEGFNSDHVFPRLLWTFSNRRQSLMVAVLATTMSTLDSTINALCATLYNDILPKVNDAPTSQHLRNTSIISLALLVVALVASEVGC